MTQTRDYPYSIFKYCDFSINQKTNKITDIGEFYVSNKKIVN